MRRGLVAAIPIDSGRRGRVTLFGSPDSSLRLWSALIGSALVAFGCDGLDATSARMGTISGPNNNLTGSPSLSGNGFKAGFRSEIRLMWMRCTQSVKLNRRLVRCWWYGQVRFYQYCEKIPTFKNYTLDISLTQDYNYFLLLKFHQKSFTKKGSAKKSHQKSLIKKSFT